MLLSGGAHEELSRNRALDGTIVLECTILFAKMDELRGPTSFSGRGPVMVFAGPWGPGALEAWVLGPKNQGTLGHARAKITPHPPDVQKWPQTSVLGRFSLVNYSPTCFFFSVFFGLRGSFGSLPLGTILGHLKRLYRTHNQFKVKTLAVTVSFCHTT